MSVIFLKPLAVLLVLLLNACGFRAAPSFQAVPDYFRAGSSPVGTVLASGRLDPSLQFLHVTIENESPALLVLGYVDAPVVGQPAVLTWYSGTRQALQTQQGRVVYLSGLSGAPAQVRYQPSPIPWPNPKSPFTVQRMWDVPTLYQYSLQESLTLQAIDVADVPRVIQRHLSRHLLPYVPGGMRLKGAQAHPSSWLWFVEHGPAGPVSWYATANIQGSVQVVYSYQCVLVNQCLHLAPWPLAGVVLPSP